MKKVIHKLSNLIYEHEPFELVFDVPAKDAARRLSAHVHKTPFTGLGSERMQGNVSVITGVSVQRKIPFTQTTFHPIMVGKFSTEEGKTKLTGVFRLHLLVQIFMPLWLGIVALFSVVAFFNFITTSTPATFSLWIGPVIFGVFLGIIKIGKLHVIDHKQWLIEKVTNAIENG